MTLKVYTELLEVMKSRGGPYAGADIPEFFTLVEELFTLEEAEINNVLPRKPAALGSIVSKTHMNEVEVEDILERMVDRGLCVAHKESGIRHYRGIPFMPGIFEFQFIGGRETERDGRIAKLIHEYKQAYEKKEGIQRITYPVTRVIPVHRTIAAGNVIHTYDQVVSYVDKYDTIGVGTCYCRQAAKLRGEDTHEMPMEVCMWFGTMAGHITERLGGRRVTKQEAREILLKCEEAGLLHMSRNTTDDIDFLCNCDRWHCEVVTTVLKQPKPALVFNSGFQPIFDAELCESCQTCIERCPPQALSMNENDLPARNADLCFGCGVCATGCPKGAISMEAKPDFPTPPKDVGELVTALKSRAETS